MILTSNRGSAEWGDLFGDPVVATALLAVSKGKAGSRLITGSNRPAKLAERRLFFGCQTVQFRPAFLLAG